MYFVPQVITAALDLLAQYLLDQYQYLHGNCPPTPPLTQQ